MLAPRAVQPSHQQWNQRWRAPHGTRFGPSVRAAKRLRTLDVWRAGTFGLQGNSTTREVEYPWAFEMLQVSAGRRILEIGGGLSGFQFVLAKSGATVTNVDPLLDYGTDVGYRSNAVVNHATINRALRTNVQLVDRTIDDAGLPAASFDAVACISTLEHLDGSARASVLAGARDLLRPGGRMVITVDLFANLAPFTSRASNQWGGNADIRQLVEDSGLRLVVGNLAELCGYPDFAADDVLSRLETFAMNKDYPQLAQMLVLEKD